MYRRIIVLAHNGLEFCGGRRPASSVAYTSMIESGLPSPKKVPYYRNKSPRYFFTEKGWKQCGHAVLSEIRSKGLQAKILSLKEKDFRINVLYKDDLQILITCRNRCRNNYSETFVDNLEVLSPFS